MKRICIMILILILLPAAALGEYKPLSAGNRGDSVLQLQQRLTSLGFSIGGADGIYGSKTTAAVKEAQTLLADAGFEVQITGKADEATLALIYDDSVRYALISLKKGERGAAVLELQNRLIDLKLLSGGADGDFGSRTEAAVIAFQQFMAAKGIDVATDGVVTPEVMQLLMSDLSEYGFHAPIYFNDADPLSLTEDDLYAPYCILIDAPTGTVLFEKEADTRAYPASTTKIMTLMLALEMADADEVVTIPEIAEDIPSDSSRVPVYAGEKMAMRDLLYGLMIRSGNDAANAIAELCAGSVDEFVALMNQRAQELGMSGTHFMNPHGYHDVEHYATARDLATMTRLGLTDPEFCQIVTCMQYTLASTSKRDEMLIENVYEIFDPLSASFIEGAAGVKSGYTSLAGFCYVGAAQRDGRTLIAVILGVPGRLRGWTDLGRLFEYGFASSY